MKIWEIILTVILGIIAYLIFRKITKKKDDKQLIDPHNDRECRKLNKRMRDEVLLDLRELREPWIMLLGLVLQKDEDNTNNDKDEVTVSLSERDSETYPEDMREKLHFFERPRFKSDIERLANDDPKLLEDTKVWINKKMLWSCTPQYRSSLDEIRMFFISDEMPEVENELGGDKTAFALGGDKAVIIDKTTARIVKHSELGDSISLSAEKYAGENNLTEDQVWDVLSKDIPALLNSRAVFVSSATNRVSNK